MKLSSIPKIYDPILAQEKFNPTSAQKTTKK